VPAKPKWSRDEGKQFIQSICITVTMQLNTFVDKRMKILYVLSFMCGGMAHIWAEYETSVVLSNMSMFSTLPELLACIERTLGDPYQERMVHSQLHTLKMMAGMMVDKYMAKFELLSGRTVYMLEGSPN